MRSATTPTVWRDLTKPLGMRVSLVLLVALCSAALLAPWIEPFDPQLLLDPIGLRSRYPSWAHPLGTDPYSRDLLSRMLAGTRVSLSLAAVVVAIATGIGTVVGATAGYHGGMVDRILVRITDIGLSIPRVVLLLAIVGLWGTPSLAVVAVVVGATGWMAVARLVRGEVHALRTSERVLAARALGLGNGRILRRHIMPDVLPQLLVSATLGFGQVLLLESGLSFLGVGVRAPQASWGTVLLDVSDVIGPARWLMLGPGLTLMFVVLAIHRVGDGIQDALHPGRGA